MLEISYMILQSTFYAVKNTVENFILQDDVYDTSYFHRPTAIHLNPDGYDVPAASAPIKIARKPAKVRLSNIMPF